MHGGQSSDSKINKSNKFHKPSRSFDLNTISFGNKTKDNAKVSG